MSKSLGNVVVPNKVMQQLGADILRLWVASTDYQADVRVSDDILKQVAEVYKKIRNTFRFLLGNLNDFDPVADRIPYNELREVDQYILVKLNKLIEKVTTSYENYEFAAIYHAFHNFCTIDLSSFYLDIAKDVLYIEAENAHARRSIQTVLYDSLLALVKLITPILPHTADEVWSYISSVEEASVQLVDMPEPIEIQNAEQIVAKWDSFMELRDDVLKALENARNEKVIGKSLTAAITLYPNEKTKELLQEIEELHKLFIVSDCVVAGELSEAPAEAQQFENVAVVVSKAAGETCERCWVVSQTVGEDADHPTICKSCATIVKEHYVS